jgi:hypothetical protein
MCVLVEVSDLADPENKEDSEFDPHDVELDSEDHSYLITMDL